MVAVALLLFLIIGVGVVFKSASSAVGLSEATGSVFAQVIAIYQQLESDVHGISKIGFLVIRCRAFRPSGDSDFDPNNIRFRRYDQISFISTGKFTETARRCLPEPLGLCRHHHLQHRPRLVRPRLRRKGRRWWRSRRNHCLAASITRRHLSSGLTGAATGHHADPELFCLDPTYEGGFLLGRQAMLMLNPPATVFTGTYPSGYASISQYTPTNTLTATSPAAAASPPRVPSDHHRSPTDAAVENQTTLLPSPLSRVDVAYTSLSQRSGVFHG